MAKRSLNRPSTIAGNSIGVASQIPGPRPAALGFRVHSGWAAMVALADSEAGPEVLDRRRLELADRSIQGSVQPFHAAEGLSLSLAEQFLQRCRNATHKLARHALRSALDELAGKSCRVVASCVLLSSGRRLPALEAILASHALIHTAEGEFFRDAITEASKHCGLQAMGIRERELVGHCETALGVPGAELLRRIAQLGKTVGPPWRQDEKLASLAAWLALA